MIVWLSWIFSICEIYVEYKDCRSISVRFSTPWPAFEVRKVLSVTKHGFVFSAQLACYRLRDSRVRWIEKIKREETGESRVPSFFLFPAPPTFLALAWVSGVSWGKGEKWKRKRERTEGEKRLTQMLLLGPPTPTQHDSIPSNQNYFRSLGCQLHVSKSSLKINPDPWNQRTLIKLFNSDTPQSALRGLHITLYWK